MWWTFPVEIVDQVLIHLSFDEYVALTQTSSCLRQALDTDRQHKLVVDANVGLELQGHEFWNWPSKQLLWCHVRELRSFLSSVKAVYPSSEDQAEDPCSSIARDQAIQTVLNKYAVSSTRLVAVLMEFKDVKAEFDACARAAFSQIHHPVNIFTASVTSQAWCRKLLQLNGIARVVEFFMSSDAQKLHDATMIENTYYELSRCYNDFTDLAHFRAQRLAYIEEGVCSYISAMPRGLEFPVLETYHAFVAAMIRLTLSRLNTKRYKPGFGGNVLRIYQGMGGETVIPYMAIVGRVLSDIVFHESNVFWVAGKRIAKPKIALTPFFLKMDETYILVSLDDGTSKFYDEDSMHRMPSTVRPQAMGPLTVRSVLQRAFEIENPDPAAVGDISRAWKCSLYNPNIVKLRFLRTMLLTVYEGETLDAANFRSLIYNPDLFLFFHAAAKAQSDHNFASSTIPDIPSFTKNTENLRPIDRVSPGLDPFERGDIVLNQSANYVGLILGSVMSSHHLEKLLSVFPFDNPEYSIASESGISQIFSQNDIDRNLQFLNWLMGTDGLIIAGCLIAPTLNVMSNKLYLDSAGTTTAQSYS